MIRVVSGLAVLLLAVLAVQRDRLTAFERDVFRLINDLPEVVSPVMTFVMQAGNVLAVAGVAVIALALTRRRAAFDAAAAGVGAWFAAKLVKDLVQRPRPGGLLRDVLRYGPSDGLGFVSGHSAVAAALATALSPYLPRPWRRAVWGVAFAVGVARIYTGAHLPLDVVGGLALGWMIGAAVHVALGAPHRVPGLDEAGAVLRRAGYEVGALARVPGSPRGSFPFTASLRPNEPDVFVKLLDPEPRDRDWIFRIARFIAFRDVRVEASLADSRAQADHEAAMALLARASGVHAPVVRGIEVAGSRVWLIEDRIAGTDLTRQPHALLDDHVLERLWRQIASLRAARVAHRDLVASNVLVDDRGDPWLVDFSHALSAAPPHALDNDVAELLVSTAMIVGGAKAVAAAAGVLGPSALTGALAELQPLALTAENRRRLRAHPGLIREVRARVAEIAGVSDDSAVIAQLEPSSMRAVATGATGVVAIAVLALTAGAGRVGAGLQTAGLRWLGLAGCMAVITLAQQGAILVAAVNRPLGLGRTAVACLVGGAVSTIGTRARGVGMLVSYLERSGVPSSAARAALGRATGAAWASWSVALAVSLAATWEERSALSAPEHLWLLASTALAILVVHVATRSHEHQRVEHGAAAPAMPLAGVAVMMTSALGSSVAGAVCTVAAVAAVGGGPAVALLVAVHLVVVGVSRFDTVWGAPGAGDVMLALALAATGLPLARAVGAAVVSRLLLFWLPLAGGHLLTRPLLRRVEL